MEIKIRRAGHVVLRVTDVAREKSLLEDVVGFTTFAQAGESFFFMTSQPVSNHHMIAIRPGKDGERMPDPERQIGMVMISYEAMDFAELRRIYRRIIEHGAEYGASIVNTGDRGHTNNFTMADADGNRIEFYCYVPEDQAADAAPYVLRGPIADRLNGAEPEPEPPAPETVVQITAKLGDMKLRVRRTSHLTLRCSDRGRSLDFYRDMLNLFVLAEDETGRVYLAGDADTRQVVLALCQADERADESDVPVPTPKKMYGMEHFSIEISSFPQLQAIYRRFKDNQVTIDHTMDHGITNSIYFLDPDGNLIEVYHDLPRAEYREPVYPFASYGPIDDRLAQTD